MKYKALIIGILFIGFILFGCIASESRETKHENYQKLGEQMYETLKNESINESVILGVNECLYNSTTTEFRCGKPMLLLKQGIIYNVNKSINISFCGLASIMDIDSNETYLIYLFGKSDQLIRLNSTNNETSRKALGYFVLFRDECNVSMPSESNDGNVTNTLDLSNMSPADVLNLVKPEIDTYCQKLEDKYIHSGCPTCEYTDLTNKDKSYVYVEDASKVPYPYTVHAYSITNEGDLRVVKVNLYLIYGWGDRPGNVMLTFKIDKNGKIVYKDLPEKNCT